MQCHVCARARGSFNISLVLGSHSRLFKNVFQQANSDLMDVFGMQMAELPKAERVTIRQKRGRWIRAPSCTKADAR